MKAKKVSALLVSLEEQQQFMLIQSTLLNSVQSRQTVIRLTKAATNGLS